MEEIMQAVSDYYKIGLEELLSHNKKTVLAGQVAMYLSKTITGESFLEVAHKFGKDHVTVIYACRKIERQILLDKKLATTIEILKEELCVKNVEIKKCVSLTGPDGDHNFEVEATVKNTYDQEIRLISTSCMLVDEEGIGRGVSYDNEEEVLIEQGEKADIYIRTPYVTNVTENSTMVVDVCFCGREFITLGSHKLPEFGETLTIKNDKLVAGSVQLYGGSIKMDEPDDDGEVILELAVNVRNISDNYIQCVELKCRLEDKEKCEMYNSWENESLPPRSTIEIVCSSLEKEKRFKNCEAKLDLLVYVPLGTDSIEATPEKE